MSQLSTISGYVPTRKYSELDSDRYTFITLDQVEPNPGLPDSDGALFVSDSDGTRRFTTQPRLTRLSFKAADPLEQVNPATDPTYFLVFKREPGSGLAQGLDDSVAWSLGQFEEVDTLQTVTDRGNVTTQGITVNSLTTVANAAIGTNLVVGGNLTVNGTTTTLNTNELTVDDLNIQIADGAPDAASADGAGLTVDGAGATFTYTSATDRWNMNKALDIGSLYADMHIFLDAAGEQSIRKSSSNLNVDAATTRMRNGDGTRTYAAFSTGSISLQEVLTAQDSAIFQGKMFAQDVPAKTNETKILFRRSSDGLILEGEVDVGNVDKVSMQATDSDATFYPLISLANGGVAGFDSAEFDLDLTYNAFSNTMTMVNLVTTGLADLDSTNVAGDLQLKTDPGISKSGRLLDSEGRSFVIYDSSGNLLWGNNGTSAGNLGGAQAVNLNLGDLADVELQGTPADGEVLKYDASEGYWFNAPDLTGTGGSGIALTDLSVTQNASSGTGTLTYNSLNGVFTYTPPELPDITTISLLDLTDVAGDGTNGQVLSTDGNGNFSFVDQTGGGGGGSQNVFSTIAVTGQSSVVADTTTDTVTLIGGSNIGITTDPSTDEITFTYTGSATGLASRGSISGTTSTLADDASANLTVANGFGSYALLKIATDRAAWVRLYVDTSSRTADASRVITDDPAPDAGVIAEVITTGAETIKMSPGVIGWLESGTDIPVRVTNKSGTSAAVQVTLTLVQLEA